MGCLYQVWKEPKKSNYASEKNQTESYVYQNSKEELNLPVSENAKKEMKVFGDNQ